MQILKDAIFCVSTKKQKDMCTASLTEINILQHTSCFDLLNEVSAFSGISVSDLKSKNRKRHLVDIRFIYCILAKTETNASLSVIGSLINRDHATVLSALRNKYVVQIQTLLTDFYAKRFNL